MSLMQREKGKRFERQIARDLKALWPGADVHRSSQAERARNPDVVIEGDAPLLAMQIWFECQDARAPTPRKKLEQAERDIRANDAFHDGHDWYRDLPIVIWHRIGQRSIQATMRDGVYMDLVDLEPHGKQTGVLVTIDFEDLKRLLRALPMLVAKEAAA